MQYLQHFTYIYVCIDVCTDTLIVISSAIVYLQRLKVTLEEDKRTQRLKSLEVHSANLIRYSKLGVMYPFVHVHLLFISDSIHNLQTVGDIFKKYAGTKVTLHVNGYNQS